MSIAMIGAKGGDQVLFVGRDHSALAAEVALVTGLNGRTLALAPVALQPQFEAAAAEAGSLIELATHESGPVPVEGMLFDVVVWAAELAVLSETERTSRLRELMMLLRPGGRAVILDGASAPRRFRGPRPLLLPAEAVIGLLTTAGGLAARALASADGLNYYEARIAR
jgi:SAM-dependent methyltransferase